MIKSFIVNIINKFITNQIQLNLNGLYTFKEGVGLEKPDIKSCITILEETLKELDYLKKDESVSRDMLYKLITDMEDVSDESLILYMAYLMSENESENKSQETVDKINQLLLSKFHTNDIDFIQGILVSMFKIKYDQTDNKMNDIVEVFLQSIVDFKTMLVSLTVPPYEKDLSVCIYNDILLDDNIDMNKKYKIKNITNSIYLMSEREDRCFDAFYQNPGENPLRETQPARVFLKSGWERVPMKPIPISGITRRFVNSFYKSLMMITGKISDADVVFFRNESMCQRRWRNFEIRNIEEEEADLYDDKYIDLGENIYNLYDPDVSEHTDPNSFEYKNNEILQKIWFYEDDIFPVETNPSPKYNIERFRNEFSFKKLNIENRDIFKTTPFTKYDFHYIVPLLWLYKIYSEYKSLIINETDINQNIELLFNYFKPADLLIYFKRYILIENNPFDNETLSFLIILGALSHITSNIVDKRVITYNLLDFNPKNFKLFQTGLINKSILKLIKTHKTKKEYLDTLKNIIPILINSNDLKSKIEEEYEAHNSEKKLDNLKIALNIIQLTGSANFVSLMLSIDENVIGYNLSDPKPIENYTRRQLVELDRIIQQNIPDVLIAESVDSASSLSTILDTQTSNINIFPLQTYNSTLSLEIVPFQVDLMLAKNLTEVVSGTKTVSGLTISKAREILGVLKLKSTISLSDSIDKHENSYTNISSFNQAINQEPIIVNLFQNFRERIQQSSLDLHPISNLQLMDGLRDIFVLNTNNRDLARNIEISEHSKNILRDPNSSPDWITHHNRYLPIIETTIDKIRTELKLIEKNINFLKSIVDKVPKVEGVKSIKVLPQTHGVENLKKRIIADCGNFKWIGNLGEPGKITVFSFPVGHESMFKNMFNGVPDPSTLTTPESNFCILPDIEFQIRDSNMDDLLGGTLVEITYEDGHTETKDLASTQQLIRIFSSTHEKQSEYGKTNMYDSLHISSYIIFLEMLLKLNGLEPSKSSLSFSSCRGPGGEIVKAGGIIRETLVVDVDICSILFTPVLSNEFIPIEVERIQLTGDQHVGMTIEGSLPVIFDPDNPRRFAGEIVNINFRADKLCFRHDNKYELSIPFTLFATFNEYLSKNSYELGVFNRLKPEQKKTFFQTHIIDRLPILIGNEHIDQSREFHYRYLELEPVFHLIFRDFFFPPAKGQGFLEQYLGTPDDTNMPVYLRHEFQKIHRQQKGGFPKTYDLYEKIQEFYTLINHYKTNQIVLDQYTIVNLNNSHYSNIILSLKIMIEKFKIQINHYKKKNLQKREDFFRYLYTYFFEVIYWQLLTLLNDYKTEIRRLSSKINKGHEYFNLFNNMFINDTLFDFKVIQTKKKVITKTAEIEKKIYLEYKRLIYEVFGSNKVDDGSDFIETLQNIQILTAYNPIFTTILEKNEPLYNEIIIKRWATYVMLYNIPIDTCSLKLDIDKIETGLIMAKSTSTTILKPLTLFIPNYNSLVDKNYKLYLEKTTDLIVDKNYSFIDNDFLIIYYSILDTEIQNIQHNINEIRKISIDIENDIINRLDQPVEQIAKNNLNSYNKQLSYFLNNSDEMYNFMTDNTYLESDVIDTSTIETIPLNLELWIYQKTPNTIENRLHQNKQQFRKDFNKVVFYKSIDILIT